MTDRLTPILARKRLEIARRLRHRFPARPEDRTQDRRPAVLEALRRAPRALPRIIAEIKRASPSAGQIRARALGDIEAIAAGYFAAGAAAVSVLADGPGFGGGVLDVRRAARLGGPILFKEFVLDEVQVRYARLTGASMVLLLVRALEPHELRELIRVVLDHGMEPVVEAADASELGRALETDATIVGINARDLKSFSIDPERAARAMESIPRERIAVYMSGVNSSADLDTIATGRADAVLIGTEMMAAPSPGERLRALLAGAKSVAGTIEPAERGESAH